MAINLLHIVIDSSYCSLSKANSKLTTVMDTFVAENSMPLHNQQENLSSLEIIQSLNHFYFKVRIY